MTIHSRDRQRRIAELVLQVHVRARVEERGHHVPVAALRRDEERRRAAELVPVLRGACIEERGNLSGMY